jgi:hypothetical protein
MTYLTNTSRVDASYDGSLFATLLTCYKVYSIQMPQTHCKIINWQKYLWIKIVNLDKKYLSRGEIQ